MWRSASLLALIAVQCQLASTGSVSTSPLKRCGNKVDLAFVLDASGSVRTINFQKMKNFVIQVVSHFNIGRRHCQVGVVVFSKGSHVEFPLDKYSDINSLAVGVNRLRYDNGAATYTHLGLSDVRTKIFAGQGSRATATKVCVLVTDGRANYPYNAEREANMLKQDGVRMFSIGIGHNTRQVELEALSSDKDHVTILSDFSQLKSFSHRLAQQICEELNRCGSGLMLKGDSCIKQIEEDMPESIKLDMVMLIDSSKFMPPSLFTYAKSLVKEILGRLYIDKDFIRIVIGTYSTMTSYILFPDASMTASNAIQQVDRLKFLGGEPMIDSALQTARVRLFPRIARADIPKVVLLVGSGKQTNSRPISFIIEEAKKLWSDQTRLYYIGVGTAFDRVLVERFVPATDIIKFTTMEQTSTPVLTTIRKLTNDANCGIGMYAETTQCRVFNPCLIREICSGGSTCQAQSQGQSFSCLCPVGTTYIPPHGCVVEKEMDLLFVVDVSSYMTGTNLIKYKTFMTNFVQTLHIHPRYVRVAFIAYDGLGSSWMTYFNQGQTLNNVLWSINRLQLRGGGEPSLLYVLQNLDTLVYQKSRGARVSAPKMILLLSGGRARRDQVPAIIREMSRLRELGVTAHTLTVGQDQDPKFLHDVSFPYSAIDITNVTNYGLFVPNISEIVVKSMECKRGHFYRGGLCKDVNECSIPGICGSNGRCSNIPGSYTCSCTNGLDHRKGEGCVVSKKLDLVIALDNSNQLTPADFANCQSAAEEILRQLHVDDDWIRVTVLTYSTKVMISYLFSYTQTPANVMEALAKTSYTGNDLNFWGAVNIIRTNIYTNKNGARSGVQRIVLLIGSGQLVGEQDDKVVDEALSLLTSKVTLYMIAVGNNINQPLLNRFIFPSNFIPVAESSSVSGRAVHAVISRMNQDSECGAGQFNNHGKCQANNICDLHHVCTGEAECMNIGYTYRCQCVQGFLYDGKYGCVAAMKMDLAFVVDVSQSMTPESLEQTKLFIQKVVETLYIHADYVRVAILGYGQVRLGIYYRLNQAQASANILSAVRSLTPLAGSPGNLKYALEYVDSQVLSPKSGARAGVRKVIYIITSGTMDVTQIPKLQSLTTKIRSQGAIIPTVSVGHITSDQSLRRLAFPYLYHSVNVTHNVTFTVNNVTQLMLSALTCSKGEFYSEGSCVDINECLMGPCGPGAECENTKGAFICTCQGDYKYDTNYGCQTAKQIDLAFLVDSSPEFGSVNIDKAKEFLEQYVSTLYIGSDYIRVALVEYFSNAMVRLFLSTGISKPSVLGTIKSLGVLRPGPGNLAHALKITREHIFNKNGARPGVPKVAVIIANGNVRESQRKLVKAEVSLLHAMSVVLPTFTIGPMNANSTLLKEVSYPHRVLDIDEQDDVIATINQVNMHVVKDIGCSKGYHWQYGQCRDLDECGSKPCAANATCVNRPGTYECRCRPGYQYSTVYGCQVQAKMDIVFAIDASDYMGAANFRAAMRSVETFTERLYVNPRYVRVGVVTYHKALTIAPFLRDSVTNQVVSQALSIHKFKGGIPDLASTLRLLRMKVFHVSNGARPGIPKLLFLVNTGQVRADQKAEVIKQTITMKDDDIRLYDILVTPRKQARNSKPMDELVYPRARVTLAHRRGSSAVQLPPSLLSQITNEITCAKGMHFIDGHCKDLDECEQQNVCMRPAQCHNTVGSYFCSCPPGFAYSRENGCQDVDECKRRPDPCIRARCFNIPGSYRCMCPKGFSYSTARAECVDVNECKFPKACTGIAKCANKLGGYVCQCPPGHSYRAKFGCQDNNECRLLKDKACAGAARCRNLDGSFECLCPRGYYYSKLAGCQDIDECTKLGRKACADGATCHNQNGTYSCTCETGFRYDKLKGCRDVDECENRDTCRGDARCQNTGGSYACLCDKGYKYDEDDGCEDVDECEELKGKACIGDSKCNNLAGRYECRCKDGYYYHHITGCQDINECDDKDEDACKGDATCVNMAGSHMCSCPEGFQYNKHVGCEDVDECKALEDEACKGDMAVCKNRRGGYKCVCKDGFQYDDEHGCQDVDECKILGHRACTGDAKCKNKPGHYDCVCEHGFEYTRIDGCIDIDECDQFGSHACRGEAHCKNKIGSYECACPTGFNYSKTKGCIDVDECHLRDFKACVGEEVRCVNNQGGWKCLCKPGWHYHKTNDKGCRDIDECELYSPHACTGSAKCRNSPGSYACTCPDGYTYSKDKGCTDVDECLMDDACEGEAKCINSAGSFQCLCDHGDTYKNDTGCQDVNECEDLGDDACVGTATCDNEPGTYKCECPDGYNYDITLGCVDIDECARFGSNACSGSALCKNQLGTYKCECHAGFYYDKKTGCQDVDECSHDHSCRGEASCENTVGGFNCLCHDGYTYDTNKGCLDIDECVHLGEKACIDDATCHNSQGSYRCSCQLGYFYDTTRGCQDVDECQTDEKLCMGMAKCSNVPSTFVCKCPASFVYDETVGCLVNTATDLVFMLETAEKSKDHHMHLLRFINMVIQGLNIADASVRVGLFTFNQEPNKILYLSESYNHPKASLMQSIAKLESGVGEANILKAFNYLRQTMLSGMFGARPDASKVVMYVGGGDPDDGDRDAVYGQMREFLEHGTRVYAYVDNEDEDEELCRTLAFPHPYYQLDDIDDLHGHVHSLLVQIAEDLSCKPGYMKYKGICDDIDECENPHACASDAHCQNHHSSYHCSCKPEFKYDSNRGCLARKSMDLIFLIDGSSAMGNVEFHKALDYVRHSIRRLSIGPEDVQVAVAVYHGHRIVGQLSLNEGQTYDATQAVINQLDFPGGPANVGFAMEKLRTTVLKHGNGARAKAPKAIVLLTNGQVPLTQMDSARQQIQLLHKLNIRVYPMVTSPLKQTVNDDAMAIMSFPHRVSNYTLHANVTNSVRAMLGTLIEDMSCPAGYYKEANACVDINECRLEGICGTGASCANDVGGYTCTCTEGFQYDKENGCVAQVLMDLAFLFDNSANTTLPDFQNGKRLISGIVNKMHVSDLDVRTALSYASGGQLKSNLVFKIPQSMHQFTYSLDALSYMGSLEGTDLSQHLKNAQKLLFCKENGARPTAAHTLVVLYGKRTSPDEMDEYHYQAQILRDNGIRVYAIILGEAATHMDASRTGEYFLIPNISDKTMEDYVQGILIQIVRDSGCKIGFFHSGDSCEDKNECLRPSPCRVGATCQNLLGSYTCRCQNQAQYDNRYGCIASKKLDIAFLIDGSTIMGRANFDRAKEIVSALLKRLRLGAEFVRYTIVVYKRANGYTEYKPLSVDYDTNTAVVTVSLVKYEGGKPVIKPALDGLKARIFDKSSGGRPDAPKVAIVLTSGEFDTIMDSAQAARAVQRSGIRMYGISFGGKKTMGSMIKLFYKGNWQLLNNVQSFDLFNFITVFNQDSGCQQGYNFVQGQCTDLDECAGAESCPDGATCSNKPGGYTCTCGEGYTYDEKYGCSMSLIIGGVGGGAKIVCTDSQTGKQYSEDQQWVTKCINYKCTANGIIRTGIRCEGMKGKCHELNSEFPYVYNNVMHDCRCSMRGVNIHYSCRPRY